MSGQPLKSTTQRELKAVLAEAHGLPFEAALAILQGVAEQVQVLHASGMLHGAIAPDEISVDDQFRVQLSEPMPRAFSSDDAQVNLPLILRETDPFVLPAQIEVARAALKEAGVAIEPRQIDHFQLGALACQLFAAATADAYLCSPRVKGAVPRALRPLVDRCLSETAENKLEHVDQFLRLLDACREQVVAGASAVDCDERRAGSEASETPPRRFQDGDTPGVTAQADEETSTTVPKPFTRLGHYQILERMGSGGMGDVYKGYEESLHRTVAIKVLPQALARETEFVERFHAEAAAAARLDHPNIIPIYFIGEDAGHHFFAMQYVEGETLAELLMRSGPLEPNEAVETAEACLAGLEAAHAKGVVHRDVKPGNILIDRRDRRVVLADFGLMKEISAPTAITSKGVIMGTVDYISPEQGRSRPVDGRSDLYSLGVVMYQMLSGRLPFNADSPPAMIFQHVYEPPTPLAEVAPNVPIPLQLIVAKLMSKLPTDRYSDAETVLNDLRAYKAGGRLPSGADTESVTLLDDAPVVDAPRAGEQPEAAPSKSDDTATFAVPKVLPAEEAATEQSDVPDSLLAIDPGSSLPASGVITILKRSAGFIAVLAATVIVAVIAVLATGYRFRLGSTDPALNEFGEGEVLRLVGHDAPVWAVAISPDGRRAVSGSGVKGTAVDNSVRIWDLETGKELQRCDGHTDRVLSVDYSPDGKRVLAGSQNNIAFLWDAGTGRALHKFDHLSNQIVAIDPKRERALVGGGTLQLVDMHVDDSDSALNPIRETPKGQAITVDMPAIRNLSADMRGGIRALAYDRTGRFALTCGRTSRISLWDVEDGRVIRIYSGHEGGVNCVAFSRDNRLVASGGQDSTVRIWDIANAWQIQLMKGHSGEVSGVAFSPDGKRIVSGAADKTIRVWDLKTGKELHQFTGHTGHVRGVAVSPDGKLVLSGSEDKTVRLWHMPDLEPGPEPQQPFTSPLEYQPPSLQFSGTKVVDVPPRRSITVRAAFAGHNGPVTGLAFARHWWGFRSAGRDGIIFRLSPASHNYAAIIGTQPASIAALVMPPNTTTFATTAGDFGMHDNEIRIWRGSMVVQQLKGHTGVVSAAVFSADHQRLLSGSKDGTVRLWDVEAAQQIGQFDMPKGRRTVQSLAWSADEKRFLVGVGDPGQSCSLWDIERNRETVIFQGATTATSTVGFLPGGKKALWHGGGKVCLWDLETGEELKRLGLRDVYVSSVAMTPDARCALLGTDKGPVLLWDVEHQRRIKQYLGHNRPVDCVVFAPDLYRAASGSPDGAVRIWELPHPLTGGPMNTFRDHQGSVETIAFSPDGTQAVSAGQDGGLVLHDLIKLSSEPIVARSAPITKVAFSLNGERIAFCTGQPGSQDNYVGLRSGSASDLKRVSDTRRLLGHGGVITAVCFRPRDRQVASASLDGTVRIWDVRTGEEKACFEVGSPVHTVALSPDGLSILTGSDDGIVRLWEIQTHMIRRQFEGHEGAVLSTLLTAAPARIIAGGADGSIRIWHLPSATKLRVLNGHEGPVTCLAATASGRYIVSGGDDHTLRLWSIDDGKEKYVFAGHTGPIRDVAISPSNDRILSASADGTVRLWDMTIADEGDVIE